MRLHDVVLESAVISPAGAISAGGARISDARLAGAASTLVLEGLDLDGVERDGAGVVKVESGRAGVVDHTRTGMWAAIGTGLELAGGTVSDDAWTARSVRLETIDVGTVDASWTLRGLALDEAAGGDELASARFAGSEALELGFGGHHVVVEHLSVDSPSWREGAVGARAAGAASTTLDTVQQHRWRSDGWRLTGVERAASGRASADTASLETLVLIVAGDSTTGAQGVEFDELSFDGESAVRAAGAVAERAYHRAGDGADIDVAGLSADGVEWNGETLAAVRGTAPLVSVAAAALRASFDGVAFASARVSADSAHEFATLSSESVRGRVEQTLEWSAGALAIDGYRAPAVGGTTIDFVEARNLDLVGDANEARVRADRAAARGMRVELSGETTFADAEVEGITVHDTHGRNSTSARALRASPLTMRESALEIGTLSLSGIESAIAVSENGDWEFPALPIGAGDATSSFAVRVQEAGIADSGSVVRITDRTTEPAFSESFVIDHATLRGFDPAAIGVPARFSIETTAGVLASLRADGALVPTLTGTDLDLKATVRGLSLRELSPYARLHLGRSVERGLADVALDVTLRASELEGVADVTLSDVSLGESGPPASSSESGVEAAAALGAALEALTDERGRIELEVPLGGRPDAPGFDLDGLVARALERAALVAVEASPRGERWTSPTSSSR